MIEFLLVGDDFPAAQVLQILLKDDRARIVAVCSSLQRGFDARMRALTRENDIPLFASDWLKTNAAIDDLARMGFDWLININSTIILPAAVLALARAASINMHPGRLPEYAGLHTHQWALRNGEMNFAITIHFMEAGLDTGDIILQREFEISPRDTGLSLYYKCMREGVRGLTEVLQMILAGQELPRIPQDLSRYRLFRHRDALESRIDWSKSAAEIERFIRAGNYAPLNSPTYTACLDRVSRNGGEEQPQVLSAEIVDLPDDVFHPGTVLHTQADLSVMIVCGDSLGVRLDQVRWPSDHQLITTEKLLLLLPHGSRQKGRAA